MGAADISGRVGQTVIIADGVIERMAEEDVILMSMTVQTPYRGRDDYLVVGRFQAGGRSLVAFHGASTFWEAVKGFLDRMINRTLVMKEDQYADK